MIIFVTSRKWYASFIFIGYVFASRRDDARRFSLNVKISVNFS